MQRNLDAQSEPEPAISLLTRRNALRRGMFGGLGMTAVVAVSGCADGEDDEEDDDDD